ncbi:MAG: hypothetical protein ACK58L_21765 [Planctomycetota bacterium]
MFLSALLKSFSQIAREKKRLKACSAPSAYSVEVIEQRLVLSPVTYLGSELPPASPGRPDPGPPGPKAPLTNLPLLNSKPGAPVSVILKVDGYTDNDPGWIAFRNRGSGPIVTPAFDLDNDPLTFNAEELRQIEEMWYRVAEDFSPFNINVTTVAPPVLNDFEHVMVVIGGDNDWAPSAGGWGAVDGFSSGGANTNYVFSKLFSNPHQIASASSHETGHTMGLRHQSTYDSNGNKIDEYNPGNANWAPLMGVGYSAVRDTWWNGPNSTSSTTLQDDMATLTRPANKTIALRTDDYGNTFATAFQVPITGPVLTRTGVLESNGDIDMFRVETDAGPVSFSVEGLDLRKIYSQNTITPGTNANLILRLYSENGTLIAEDSPANSLSASVSATVTSGVYYVAVTHDVQYGSIGQYTLTGNIIPLPVVPTMIGPSGTLANALPVFQWTIAGNAASYELQVDNLTLNKTPFYSTSVPTNTHTPPSQFPEGNYQARVRSVQSNGQASAWSEYLSFVIDIPAPAEPVITRPQGDIADSFPTFEWNPAQNAAYYSLWVSNRVTGQRVIFRTNHATTSYTHFDPLPDGDYRAWVRSFNTVGEFSAWSKSVDFSIDTPIPKAPSLTAPSATTSSTNPRFVFTNVEGAARYDLWVNNLSTGKVQYLRVQDIPRTATFYDPPTLPQGNYIAWIRALNGNNEASPWSAARSFTVDVLPPSRPNFTGPKGPNNSLTVETLTPKFEWTSAARAVKYDLWVNNVTLGLVQYIRNTEITSTSFTSLTNLKQGLHRAFVRGINIAGEVGEWSNPYEFTVDEPAPLKPMIVAPVSNPAGSVDSANPTFSWTIETDAPFYELQIDNVTQNKTGVISVKGLTAKTYTIPNAQRLKEETYSARVRAYNSSGDVGEWSDSFRIRVDVPEPTTPIIIGPTNSSKDTTPQFQWVHTNTSFRYEILVRDTERNETIVLNVVAFQLNPNQTEAFYVLPDAKALKPSTYRFWIRAFNSLGQSSAWSTAQTFVIMASLDPDAANPNVDSQIEDTVLVSLLHKEMVPQESTSIRRDGETSEQKPAELPLQSPKALFVAPVMEDLIAGESSDSGFISEFPLLDSALGQIFDPASSMLFADLMNTSSIN